MNVPKKPYYVKMVDTFLSGWGPATGKRAVFIFGCDTYEEAATVETNANYRPDQKNVQIVRNLSGAIRAKDITQYKDKETDATWYKKNYFYLQDHPEARITPAKD